MGAVQTMPGRLWPAAGQCWQHPSDSGGAAADGGQRTRPGRSPTSSSGDCTNADDLRRAGIEEATAAIICPADASNDADMRSILTVMAIETGPDSRLEPGDDAVVVAQSLGTLAPLKVDNG